MGRSPVWSMRAAPFHLSCPWRKAPKQISSHNVAERAALIYQVTEARKEASAEKAAAREELAALTAECQRLRQDLIARESAYANLLGDVNRELADVKRDAASLGSQVGSVAGDFGALQDAVRAVHAVRAVRLLACVRALLSTLHSATKQNAMYFASLLVSKL